MGLTSITSLIGGKATRSLKHSGMQLGPKTEQGRFFQGLIQLAAGNLKRCMGNERAARNLFQRSTLRLSELPNHYLGIDVADLLSKLHLERTGYILLALQ